MSVTQVDMAMRYVGSLAEYLHTRQAIDKSRQTDGVPYEDTVLLLPIPRR
ncbi:hypothetical protein [Streptomyces canus]